MAAQFADFSACMYDGLSDPKKFIDFYKIQSIIQGWDDAAQRTNVMSFLTEKAHTVITDLAIKTQMSHIYDELRSKCSPRPEALMMEFSKRKPLSGETITKYGLELAKLLKGASPDLSAAQVLIQIRTHLKMHLPNTSNIQLLLQMHKDKTLSNLLAELDDAISLPMLKESIENSAVSWNDKPTPHSIKTEPSESNYTASSQHNRGSQQTSNTSPRFQGNCNYCGIYGHRIAFCQKRARDQQQNANSAQGQYQRTTQQVNRNPNNVSYNNNNSIQVDQQHSQSFSTEAHAEWPFLSFHNSECKSIDAHEVDHLYDDFPFFSVSNGDQDIIKTNHTEQAVRIDKLSTIFCSTNINCTSVLEISTVDTNATVSITVQELDRITSTSTSLLKIAGYISLFGEFKTNVNILIDGGSTHSFVSPKILNTAHLTHMVTPDSTIKQRRNFCITSATQDVNSSCTVTIAVIEFQDWKGKYQFTISDKIKRNDVVIGRDFLKHFSAVVDHGSDSITIQDKVIRFNENHFSNQNTQINKLVSFDDDIKIINSGKFNSESSDSSSEQDESSTDHKKSIIKENPPPPPPPPLNFVFRPNCFFGRKLTKIKLIFFHWGGEGL